ncbi:MAG: apolipoprotein N-acyltransferase [Deltaproteobacteria bacterium]|nr:apolipoprotein N-acyltransferase [Deltaproteobacteria bacterium]
MKKLVLSAISGLLLVLAFPPFGAGFLAWFALVPLLLALEGAGWKRGLLYGYVFGAAFFLGTVYWVIHSMYHYGGVPMAVSVLVMLSLVAYLSVYPGVFGLLAAVSGGLSPAGRLVLLPVFWTALEFLRGRLFTGFPWVLAGYSQANYLPVIQVADTTGVWGVSYLVVFVNTALYLAARSFLKKEGRFPARESVVALAVVVSVLSYGFLRIRQVDRDSSRWNSLRVAVAQGSIDQSLKWDRSFQDGTIDIYRGLSMEASGQGASLIVWPETAVPFIFDADRIKYGKVGAVARDAGTYILTGSPSYNYNQATGKASYYNSAYLLSPSGDPVGRYDKYHLVPFGEYVPLKRFLPFVKKLTEGVGDFSSGPGAVPIRFEGGGIGVLICYESIFPEIAAASVRNGSTLLVNITNDAWFGRTAAPYQHFEMAIFRAVENKVFLLRAANTGISAVIGPSGRVRKKIGLFEKGALVDGVGLKRGALTLYSLYGDFFPWGCAAITGVFLLTALKGRRF